MSIDEAIKHCEEVAEKLEKKVKPYQCEAINKKLYEVNKKEWDDCLECAKEHRQLAEWLRKLEKYEEGIEKIKELMNDYKGRNNMWDTANGMQFALECLEVNADDDT